MSDQEFDPIAAARLLAAARQGGERPRGLAPAPADTASAYAVQAAVLDALGEAAGGAWKQAMLGGKTRECAALPMSLVQGPGPAGALPPFTAIEVETAVILSGDPGKGDPIAAIAEIRLAFELLGSRYAQGTDPAPLERMADAFSNAGIILGEELPGWRNGLPDRLGITLVIDGTPVEAPEAAAPLAEALDFLTWLSGHARRRGYPLKRGDVIITGARIGPLPLAAGQRIRAEAMGAAVSIG